METWINAGSEDGLPQPKLGDSRAGGKYNLEEEFTLEEAMSKQKIRVLIAKPGLDGHDRGAKVVARALRDAGMEVIYTGLRQTPEMIAEAAQQEDVDVVGLSILSGAHMALIPRILELLKANGQENVKIFVGGIIPDEDAPRLKEMGVTGVYGPGAPTRIIIDEIRASLNPAA
jgi:methylmalonyl-CoA mutase C-terminal domain/subunit